MNPGTLIGVLKKLGVFEKKRNDWTDEECEIIRNHYPTASKQEMIELLPNRKWASINAQASKLGVQRESFFWSEDDIRYLRENYGYVSLTELESHYGGKFSGFAIKTKAQKIGCTTEPFWSAEEDEIFRKEYSRRTPQEMCELLPGRSINSIKNRAAYYGLRSGANNTYTAEEEQFLRAHYLEMTDIELGRAISRSKYSVKNKRHDLDLRRPTNALQVSLSTYIRSHNYYWHMRSAQAANGRCAITGDKATHVHHPYSFNLILKDTLEKFNVDDYEKCSDMPEGLLDEILESFYEEQDKHGLGICLRKDIHVKFHMNYGYGDNTPEQWNEFFRTFF